MVFFVDFEQVNNDWVCLNHMFEYLKVISSKVSKAVYLLRKRNNLPLSFAVMAVYHASVGPNFDYGNTIFVKLISTLFTEK